MVATIYTVFPIKEDGTMDFNESPQDFITIFEAKEYQKWLLKFKGISSVIEEG